MKLTNKKKNVRKRKEKKGGLKAGLTRLKKPGTKKRSTKKKSKSPGSLGKNSGKIRGTPQKKRAGTSGAKKQKFLGKPDLQIGIKATALDVSPVGRNNNDVPEISHEQIMETPEEVDVGGPEVSPKVVSEKKTGATSIPEPEEIVGDSDLSEIFDQDEGEGPEGEKGEEAGVERLVFSLGNEEYAIELMEIQEIIRYVEITPLPHSDESITGIISLRGTVIPIYDLRGRLNLDIGEVKRQTRIVVVKLQKGLVGLIVDRIGGVVKIPDRIIEAPPSTSGGTSSEYLKGVATLGDRMLILLNLEKAITLE